MTIISQRGNDMVSSLTIIFSFCIRLIMSTLVMGGNLLRMKLDFAFVKFVNLKLDNSFKLNEGTDKFIKG